MLTAEGGSRMLPKGIVNFLTRVLGLLPSAFAVQLVVNGIEGILQAT
jgi:small neutral amino acid transporter SnatA (MarC family)